MSSGFRRHQIDRSICLLGEPEVDPRAHALPTTQDRLLQARRLFQRAVAQATERLILSYPRADPRSGRERLPSLFFVAAASLGNVLFLAMIVMSALAAVYHPPCRQS